MPRSKQRTARKAASAAGKDNGQAAKTATPVGQQVRVPKMAELVAHQLRRQIVRGELQDGELLPSESQLMETFGVSRPTLREAYRVLEAENLLSVRRGARGGGQVHAPDGTSSARYAGLVLEHRGTTVEDVYRARDAVEVAAAGILAKNRTKADLAELGKAHRELEKFEGDEIGYAKTAHLFHQLVVDLAGNQTLSLLDEVLNLIISRASVQFAEESEFTHLKTISSTSRHDHACFLELIEARDVEGASRCWSAHCTEMTERVIGGLGRTRLLDLFGD